MSFSRLFLWGWVVLALLAAVAIEIQRTAWEGATRQVELALDLKDVQKLATDANGPLSDFLSALRAEGASALVVDPAEISDLRAAWPELAQSTSTDQMVFIDWSTLARLRHDGWALIWKLAPPGNLSPSDFAAHLERLVALAPQAYLPLDWGSGSSLTSDAAHALRLALDQSASPLASLVLLEFHDYTPAVALYGQGFARFVRAHTVSAAELQEMSPSARLARFERAAIERSARLLYLHFLPESIGNAVSDVSALSERLRHDGLRVGALPASSPPLVTWAAVTVLFAGLAALLLLTLHALWPLPNEVLAASWIFILGCELLGFAWNALLARQTAALLAATLAPISAFVALHGLEIRQKLRFVRGQAGFMWVATMALGALLGGLLGAALLSDLPFYEGLYLFRGVKLALILPILLILALYAIHRTDDPLGRSPWQQPFRWRQLALGAGVAVALMIVLLRSGNDAFLPVSGLEDQIRSLLATLFYVRPRFKEFLIGHPALFLWAAWGAPRWRTGSWPLLAIGLLGPVSVVNTYEHLHTPLVLSLARTAIGLALGLVLGWALWRAILWVERQWTAAK